MPSQASKFQSPSVFRFPLDCIFDPHNLLERCLETTVCGRLELVWGEFACPDEPQVLLGTVDHSAGGSRACQCTEEAKPDTAQELTQLDLRVSQIANGLEMLPRHLAGRVEVFDRRVLPQDVAACFEEGITSLDDLAHRLGVFSQFRILGREEHIPALIKRCVTRQVSFPAPCQFCTASTH